MNKCLFLSLVTITTFNGMLYGLDIWKISKGPLKSFMRHCVGTYKNTFPSDDKKLVMICHTVPAFSKLCDTTQALLLERINTSTPLTHKDYQIITKLTQYKKVPNYSTHIENMRHHTLTSIALEQKTHIKHEKDKFFNDQIPTLQCFTLAALCSGFLSFCPLNEGFRSMCIVTAIGSGSICFFYTVNTIIARYTINNSKAKYTYYKKTLAPVFTELFNELR